MKLFSAKTVLAFSVLVTAQASLAGGLSTTQVQVCIQQEKELYRINHPLKAQYILEERDGSVADLMRMMKENRDEMDILTSREAVGPRGVALEREYSDMNNVISSAATCEEVRKASLKFANEDAKQVSFKYALFFEQNDQNNVELQEWTREAKAALVEAGYNKAEATIDAAKQPALTILLVSGETTSVTEQRFEFTADSTMKTALRTIVGHDANATVLEDRLTEKMRKENIARLEAVSEMAPKLFVKQLFSNTRGAK